MNLGFIKVRNSSLINIIESQSPNLNELDLNELTNKDEQVLDTDSSSGTEIQDEFGCLFPTNPKELIEFHNQAQIHYRKIVL